MSARACPADRQPPVDARGVRLAAALTSAALTLALVSEGSAPVRFAQRVGLAFAATH